MYQYDNGKSGPKSDVGTVLIVLIAIAIIAAVASNYTTSYVK